MISHAEARTHIATGYVSVFGEPMVGAATAAAVGGIGLLETENGSGWKGAGKNSNNMGAITAGPKWKGATFEYRDSRPDPKTGKDVWYVTKFRKYPTPAAGFEDLVRIVLKANGRDKAVLPSAKVYDLYGVSKGLYSTTYFTGRAADGNPDARIRRHYIALHASVTRIAKALGEPLPIFVDPGKPKAERFPTLRRGSGYKDPVERDHVRVAQRALGLVADGLYGPETEKSVKKFQRAEALGVDGVVGKDTWAALLKAA